jgi:L-fuconolactonase
MKVDTHQFFWQYNEQDYGWMFPWSLPGTERFKEDHLPDDLLPQLQRVGIDGTVVVQVRQTLRETHWLLSLADQYPFIKGVIGWVDLRSPDVGEQLQHFRSHPKLCAVRHKLENEADDRFMLRQDFCRGIGVLAEFDLAFDLLIRARHLPVAYELAQMFPEQRFVLDHIGKPHIKSGRLSPWDADIRALASCPNVFCKVSGMVTEADWEAWQAADFRPYLDVVFESFGTQRIMVGSDWPECTLAASYEQVLGLVMEYTAKLSKEEQADVWGTNAVNIYGLEDRTDSAQTGDS